MDQRWGTILILLIIIVNIIKITPCSDQCKGTCLNDYCLCNAFQSGIDCDITKPQSGASTLLGIGSDKYSEMGFSDSENGINQFRVVSSVGQLGETIRNVFPLKNGSIIYTFTGKMYGIGESKNITKNNQGYFRTWTDMTLFTPSNFIISCEGYYNQLHCITFINPQQKITRSSNENVVRGNYDGLTYQEALPSTDTLEIGDMFTKIIIGRNNVLLQTAFNDFYGIGNNEYGQLFSSVDLSPDVIMQRIDPHGISTAVLCGRHSFGIKTDSIISVGQNALGELIVGHTNLQTTPIPMHESTVSSVKKLVCGDTHTIVINNNNFMYVVGSNIYGQLGMNGTTSYTTPILNPFSLTINIEDIATTMYSTMIVDNVGKIYIAGIDISNYNEPLNDKMILSFKTLYGNIHSKKIYEIYLGDEHAFALIDGVNCHGVSSSNVMVCSGNGNCIDENSCQCKKGWGGFNCSEFTCFGEAVNAKGVCNNHGNCVQFDECHCDKNYYGTHCNITSCYEIFSNNTNVCSNHGNCYDFNQCNCDLPYTGDACDVAVCFGIKGDLPSACSGHGQCVDVNQCSCQPNYLGEKCEISSCFGILSNTTVACSSNGICVEHDSCSCYEGYGSANCSLPICYNKLQTDNMVCSGYGFCEAPDTCQCNEGIYGHNCTIFNCIDFLSNSSSSCSTHGTCHEIDTCTCDAFYFGKQCEHTSCHGINTTDSHVCSGNGTCTEYNHCDCNLGYFGEHCNITECKGFLVVKNEEFNEEMSINEIYTHSFSSNLIVSNCVNLKKSVFIDIVDSDLPIACSIVSDTFSCPQYELKKKNYQYTVKIRNKLDETEKIEYKVFIVIDVGNALLHTSDSLSLQLYTYQSLQLNTTIQNSKELPYSTIENPLIHISCVSVSSECPALSKTMSVTQVDNIISFKPYQFKEGSYTLTFQYTSVSPALASNVLTYQISVSRKYPTGGDVRLYPSQLGFEGLTLFNVSFVHWEVEYKLLYHISFEDAYGNQLFIVKNSPFSDHVFKLPVYGRQLDNYQFTLHFHLADAMEPETQTSLSKSLVLKPANELALTSIQSQSELEKWQSKIEDRQHIDNNTLSNRIKDLYDLSVLVKLADIAHSNSANISNSIDMIKSLYLSRIPLQVDDDCTLHTVFLFFIENYLLLNKVDLDLHDIIYKNITFYSTPRCGFGDHDFYQIIRPLLYWYSNYFRLHALSDLSLTIHQHIFQLIHTLLSSHVTTTTRIHLQYDWNIHLISNEKCAFITVSPTSKLGIRSLFDSKNVTLLNSDILVILPFSSSLPTITMNGSFPNSDRIQYSCLLFDKDRSLSCSSTLISPFKLECHCSIENSRRQSLSTSFVLLVNSTPRESSSLQLILIIVFSSLGGCCLCMLCVLFFVVLICGSAHIANLYEKYQVKPNEDEEDEPLDFVRNFWINTEHPREPVHHHISGVFTDIEYPTVRSSHRGQTPNQKYMVIKSFDDQVDSSRNNTSRLLSTQTSFSLNMDGTKTPVMSIDDSFGSDEKSLDEYDD